MRPDHGHAELDHGRRRQHGNDDVGRGRRHAHAHNEAGKHEHDEQERQIAVHEGHEDVNELEAAAREADDAHHDARAGAGTGDHQGVAGGGDGDLLEPARREPRFLPEEREQEDDPAAREGREVHAAPEQHHHDEEGQRQQVVEAPRHRRKRGYLACWHGADIVLHGLEMDHGVEREIEQDGGQKRRLGDGEVAHLGDVGHDEGRRAHDGRHELAPRRGAGFHGAGEGRGIAHLLHQRDGENARAVHIGLGRAGDGAEKRRGENGHLGRTALGLPGQHAREVHEDAAHVGDFEKGTEEHKGENHGGRRADGHAVDAFGEQEELLDHGFRRDGHMAEGPGEICPEQAIGDEAERHDDEGQPRRPARGLQHKHDESRAEEHLLRRHLVHIGEAVKDLVGILEIKDGDAHREAGQGDVDDREQGRFRLFLAILGIAGHENKGQAEHETQVGHALQGGVEDGDARRAVELEHGEHHRQGNKDVLEPGA